MGVLAGIIAKRKKRKNPVDYWRKLGAQIGEQCELYPSAYLGTEPYLIKIGNHVRINSGVQFVTHDGGVWVLRGLADTDSKFPAEMKDADLFGEITIGNNVHVGTNVIIMPGVSVGDNCIIGCGAIVTKNVPDNSIAVGIPARVIETVETYYHKHSQDFDLTKNYSPSQKKDYLQKKYQ